MQKQEYLFVHCISGETPGNEWFDPDRGEGGELVPGNIPNR